MLILLAFNPGDRADLVAGTCPWLQGTFDLSKWDAWVSPKSPVHEDLGFALLLTGGWRCQ